MIGAVDRSIEGFPGSLFWAYQDALNRQTDILFWHQTRYKPNQKLNPTDPRDRAMIPQWWAARAHVEQGWSPKGLIRERAVEKVFDMHRDDPQPVFVHSLKAGGGETLAFPALGGKRQEDYIRARVRDSSYLAIFNANDPKWPQPVWETYPQGEIEIDQPPPSPNVSGEASRGHYRNNLLARVCTGSSALPVIYHDGLVLRPLTSDITARLPDLDPARRDAMISSMGGSGGWIDFGGNRQAPKLIGNIFQPGDVIYYWDGPWGVLAGSRGIAIVRRGVVIETFTTVVS